MSFLVPQKEPASRRPQNSYRLLLNRSKILRLPILIIALLLRIDDLVEQLTRIFLGIFGGLLHRFGSFLKRFVCYVRRIAHVVVRHSTAAIVTHINLSFFASSPVFFFRLSDARFDADKPLDTVRLNE